MSTAEGAPPYVHCVAAPEPQHSEPHFNGNGMCACGCRLCLVRMLDECPCVCLDCPCDGAGRGDEHIMRPDFPKPYISPLEFAAFTVRQEPQEIPPAFRRRP